MELERKFLAELTSSISTIQLLSQVLRWGNEGCLLTAEELPKLAIELERNVEVLRKLVLARKTWLEGR